MPFICVLTAKIVLGVVFYVSIETKKLQSHILSLSLRRLPVEVRASCERHQTLLRRGGTVTADFYSWFHSVFFVRIFNMPTRIDWALTTNRTDWNVLCSCVFVDRSTVCVYVCAHAREYEDHMNLFHVIVTSLCVLVPLILLAQLLLHITHVTGVIIGDGQVNLLLNQNCEPFWLLEVAGLCDSSNFFWNIQCCCYLANNCISLLGEGGESYKYLPSNTLLYIMSYCTLHAAKDFKNIL